MQGHGWDDLPTEFNGTEPDVAGVLTITGGLERFVFYNLWTGSLNNKNARKVLRQVHVAGAGHAWTGKAPCIVDEVDAWLHKA